MFAWQRLSYILLSTLLTCAVAFAQETAPAKRPAAGPAITMAAAGARVRFTAIGPIERMRLEVFDPSGQPVFDTGFKPGNVRDWRLVGTHGQLLPDSSYLCVVTIKDLSGKLSFKQGNVFVQSGQAALAMEGSGEPERIDTEESLSARNAVEPAAMTVVAHDGRDGQVTSTTGDLTFRTGDVFTGQDKEQMRLTEDGKLGVGTKNPQATLDVAGTVRASKGVTFPDGTVLTSATGRAQKLDAGGEPEPLVAGTGTTGKLAKWTDNAGTLGDSVVTELNNNIGVGTASPNSKLTVAGTVEVGAASGAGSNPTFQNPNNIANFSQLLFYPASGTNVNSSFSIIPRGTGQANNRAQLVLLNTDRVASPNNFELAAFKARGTDFLLATGKVGAGLDRPLMLGAGLLTSNANDGQLFLATDGKVGVGTTSPTSKLHVNGSINFTGLRTETNATSPNVIGGFSGNSVTAGVGGATIGGGGESLNNRINLVTDNFGTVGGGRTNMAGDNAGSTGDREGATVGGGKGNIASGTVSTVGGGSSNSASGAVSTVGGGNINVASGGFSTVPGGFSNEAQGEYSFAAGQRAQALHYGAFVWSDSTTTNPNFFASTADDQFLIKATGGVGINTNAPAARLHVLGTSSAAATPIAILDSSGEQIPLSFKNGATERTRLRTDDRGNLILATLNGTQKNLHFRAGDDTTTDMVIRSSTGNVGIGTFDPGTARLKVVGGHVFVAAPNSLIITSPNGSCWKIVVSDAGALTATSVTCP